jgi:hypothetical protein
MECYFVSSKHICEVLKNVSDILSRVKPNKKGGGYVRLAFGAPRWGL